MPSFDVSKAKQPHEPKVNSTVLLPGDHVLVRNLSERGGPGKLRPHWEKTIHVVVRRLTDESPVYQVRPATSKGKVRNLHRNLLLPCDYLPLETTQQSPEISAHFKKSSLQTSPELTQEVASKPMQDQQTRQHVRNVNTRYQSVLHMIPSAHLPSNQL